MHSGGLARAMQRAPGPARVALTSVTSVVVSSALLAAFLVIYWHVGRSETREATETGAVLVGYVTGTTYLMFQAVFYAALTAFVALTAATSVVVARVLRAHVWSAFVLTLFLLGIAALPSLGFMSFENDCALGRAFPFPGAECGS